MRLSLSNGGSVAMKLLVNSKRGPSLLKMVVNRGFGASVRCLRNAREAGLRRSLQTMTIFNLRPSRPTDRARFRVRGARPW